MNGNDKARDVLTKPHILVYTPSPTVEGFECDVVGIQTDSLPDIITKRFLTDNDAWAEVTPIDKNPTQVVMVTADIPLMSYDGDEVFYLLRLRNVTFELSDNEPGNTPF